MCYFLLSLASENPTYGPEWLGVMLDAIIILGIVIIVKESIEEKRYKNSRRHKNTTKKGEK